MELASFHPEGGRRDAHDGGSRAPTSVRRSRGCTAPWKSPRSLSPTDADAAGAGALTDAL
ncbi:MAG TPA: hypothetical protein VJ826_03515 [Candidatus Polarisedimenticolaceae bacterium]|nr:hypothetical protein [Candidatus Polarisedimenticolaceae bacterium]